MKNIAIALIVIALVVAVVSLFYVNQNEDLIIKDNQQNQSNNNIKNNSENMQNNSILSEETREPENFYIDINKTGFFPKELKIKQGDTILWTNYDSAKHTVTSDSGNELNSSELPAGQQYEHIFNSAGNFSYHCSFHSSMKGEVVVE